MTTDIPRPLQVVLSGVMVLGLTGCASAVESSAPASAAAVTATAPAARPTVLVTPTASVGIAPTHAPIPRNPAAMDAAVPYQPIIDPTAFSDVIDNPFLPLTPGTSFAYEGAGEQIKVEVTSERRVVMGVTTVVVKDRVFEDGKLKEDTVDWYAQDRAGNVWYFGEATTSYEKDPAGDHTGSWEAGVDGALPGVVMLGDPEGGDVYRQEFLAGQAEDIALVRHANGAIKVRAGSFERLLVTEEWTPLTPDQIELKYYARGVGLVAERLIFGGDDLVELVTWTPAGP